jgi:hypothetical protein
MKQSHLLTVPAKTISFALLITISSLIAFNTIPQAFAYQDTGTYINYRDSRYLQVGTGNLGITNELNSFNYQAAIDKWLTRYTPNAFDINDNLGTNLSAIDFIHGATEGNLSYNKNTKKWVLTNNFISHLEPSGSGRTYDNLGAYNTGITSTNCYIDRPKDTLLNPLCAQIFKEQKTNEWGVGSFGTDRRRNFFYDTKLPLLLSNYKAITIKQNAKELIDHIYAEGMGSQTTSIKLFYIDQINQLGLSGAKKLVTLDKKYNQYSRENLLTIFKKLNITNGENIYSNTWGGKYYFNNLSTDVIRLVLSRTQYFNALNSDSAFDSQQQWIADYARSGNINQAKVVTSDVIRRYTLLPQSKQEFDDMEKDAINMHLTLNEIFNIQ